LSKVAQPRLAPVLRAIQHDIDRLQSASLTDMPSVLIRLDELVVLVVDGELDLPSSSAPPGFFSSINRGFKRLWGAS
jgi:uroporphyrin-3 C-methyltransferase